MDELNKVLTELLQEVKELKHLQEHALEALVEITEGL